MPLRRKYDLSLYFILDLPCKDPIQLVNAAIQGGITALQLRGKKETSHDLFALAKALKTLLNDHPIPLIINDRLDIAMAVGADGVHIGKDDLPFSTVRGLWPDSLIGVSCYNDLERAKVFSEYGADYLAFGACYPSPTKPEAPRVSLATLRQAHLFGVPIVAIGGIQTHHTIELFENGVDGVALISAIQQAPEPQKAVDAFRKQILLANRLDK